MKVQKLLEYLDVGQAYMLRNDGQLIKVALHPYIKYFYEYSSEQALEYLLENEKSNHFLNWFLINSSSKDVQEYINILLASIVKGNFYPQYNRFLIENFKIDFSVPYTTNENELLDCFELLNNLTNQEFCKIRTSHPRFGGSSKDIYIRISSIGFNWFNLLWQLIYENKNWITSITITNDPQSCGMRTLSYVIDGLKINHLDPEEFINLSGNPIIEDYDIPLINEAISYLKKGKNISEAFDFMHPKKILGSFKLLQKDFILNNFID